MLQPLLKRYGVGVLTAVGGAFTVLLSIAMTAALDVIVKRQVVNADLIIGTLVSSFVAPPVWYINLKLADRMMRAEASLQATLRQDALTGLFNRRHFFEIAEIEFERAKRYGNPLSVMMLDLDYFKQINDQYGHLVGDKALIKVAQLCKTMMRSADLVARYGGEEFAILLPQTGIDEAELLAERLRTSIGALDILIDAHHLRLCMSIGVAQLEAEERDFDSVLARADAALYHAKNTGRNRTSRGRQ